VPLFTAYKLASAPPEQSDSPTAAGCRTARSAPPGLAGGNGTLGHSRLGRCWPARVVPREPSDWSPPARGALPVAATQISDHGAEVSFDHTANAFIAAVAELSESGVRIIATVDHDGDQFLRQRIVIYISDAVHRP
jgi:hypothetical protein